MLNMERAVNILSLGTDDRCWRPGHSYTENKYRRRSTGQRSHPLHTDVLPGNPVSRTGPMEPSDSDNTNTNIIHVNTCEWNATTGNHIPLLAVTRKTLPDILHRPIDVSDNRAMNVSVLDAHRHDGLINGRDWLPSHRVPGYRKPTMVSGRHTKYSVHTAIRELGIPRPAMLNTPSLIKPNTYRCKSGFWNSVRLTPGELDLKYHRMKRLERFNGCKTKKPINTLFTNTGSSIYENAAGLDKIKEDRDIGNSACDIGDPDSDISDTNYDIDDPVCDITDPYCDIGDPVCDISDPDCEQGNPDCHLHMGDMDCDPYRGYDSTSVEGSAEMDSGYTSHGDQVDQTGTRPEHYAMSAKHGTLRKAHVLTHRDAGRNPTSSRAGTSRRPCVPSRTETYVVIDNETNGSRTGSSIGQCCSNSRSSVRETDHSARVQNTNHARVSSAKQRDAMRRLHTALRRSKSQRDNSDRHRRPMPDNPGTRDHQSHTGRASRADNPGIIDDNIVATRPVSHIMDTKHQRPSSRSMSLYNLSLLSDYPRPGSAQRPTINGGLSGDDWRTQLSPAAWVRLLKANPGDSILQELGFESAIPQVSSQPIVQSGRRKDYSTVAASSRKSDLYDVASQRPSTTTPNHWSRPGHRRCAHDVIRSTHDVISFPFVMESVKDKERELVVQMYMASRDADIPGSDVTACRAPHNSPVPSPSPSINEGDDGNDIINTPAISSSDRRFPVNIPPASFRNPVVRDHAMRCVGSKATRPHIGNDSSLHIN